ncbi:hypothetical protein AAG570_006450 [Ranatra chinensis]|uniref:Uncharacterized protein n=1 Tax=Ranatra chinensis TaxID=642074 RepID=A0ABD0YU39_9HEMI
MTNEYSTLFGKVRDHSARLQALLENRQEFEGCIEKCQQWLIQAEVALSADMRTANLGLIQEQLNKYTKLNNECDHVGDDIKGIEDLSSRMKLAESDRLILLDTVKGLSERHTHVKGAIAGRIKALGDALDNIKQVQERVNRTMDLVGSVQAQVKELSKPVGNRAEDVQETIDAYQVTFQRS